MCEDFKRGNQSATRREEKDERETHKVDASNRSFAHDLASDELLPLGDFRKAKTPVQTDPIDPLSDLAD